MTGAAWQMAVRQRQTLTSIAALDPDSSDIRDPSAQVGDENFLIIGSTSDRRQQRDGGAGDTEIVEGARSDTIMLVNIPASRKRVVAVSFPATLRFPR